MKLTPREVEKLGLHNAGYLAQKRLARGLRLNYAEAILEFVRDGNCSVAELMELGRELLGRRQVLPSVPHLLNYIQVEGTFPDGTKLITVHKPIESEVGNLERALQGSFLPVPSLDKFPLMEDSTVPGEIICDDKKIAINVGRKAVILSVKNIGDRPIQIGSHYHFIETNRSLVFDRSKAYGMRLNILAGSATRFEPGDSEHVTLVAIGGNQVIRGGNCIADGPVDKSKLKEVMEAVHARGFGHFEEKDAREGVTGGEDEIFTTRVPREEYANHYGPTTGDKVRLGDTDLYAEIEHDFCIYGDECMFGGGKVIRDGMGQSCGHPPASSLDTVITNAVIIDYTGIFKADIGIKDGFIISLGKAGNPDVMDGVCPNLIIGANTEVISGEGLLVTSGAIDCHVHYICPQMVHEAISSGITTLVGGGTGPAEGSCATTCTPSPALMKMILQSTDNLPLNFGFTGKGNSSKPDEIHEIIRAGAMGLKLHEDWGCTPAAIDSCLAVAEKYDIQVNIHTDTLNESGFVEDTIAAFKGRTIHTYHTEGAGGGHAPDIIKVCSVKNVLPSSTNPTRPFTTNTIDEHLDMLMVCHHLDPNIEEDVAFAESRIRKETIAAEDILHDMGAISMISSDSQAMGRIGGVISRTWQTAHKMKLQREPLVATKPDDDNLRIKRYVSKYTINPAIANGISEYVGSVEVGKWADLVLWKPSFFGTKPEKVLKGGIIVWANMGDPNASIPTPEPVLMRPMYGSMGKAASGSSIAFVSKAAFNAGVKDMYGLNKRVVAVSNTRKLTKLDMKWNDALPNIQVDPDNYDVKVDGDVLTCLPAPTVPLSREYFLF